MKLCHCNCQPVFLDVLSLFVKYNFRPINRGRGGPGQSSLAGIGSPALGTDGAASPKQQLQQHLVGSRTTPERPSFRIDSCRRAASVAWHDWHDCECHVTCWRPGAGLPLSDCYSSRDPVQEAGQLIRCLSHSLCVATHSVVFTSFSHIQCTLESQFTYHCPKVLTHSGQTHSGQ